MQLLLNGCTTIVFCSIACRAMMAWTLQDSNHDSDYCATAVVNTITVQQELLQIGISCFEYAQGSSEHSAVDAHAFTPALCKPGSPLRRCYKCTCMVRVLTYYSACRLKREKLGKAESKEQATRWWC